MNSYQLLAFLNAMIFGGVLAGVLLRWMYHFLYYGSPGEPVRARRLIKSGTTIHVYEIIMIPGGTGIGAYIRLKDGESARLVRFENLADFADREPILGLKGALFKFDLIHKTNRDAQGLMFEEQLTRLEPKKRRGW